MREAAEASGVLTGAELDAGILALWRRLRDLGGDYGNTQEAAPPAARLLSLRDAISEVRSSVVAKLGALQALEELPRRYSAAAALGNLESAAIVAARKRVQDEQARLDRASAELREAQSAARQQSAAVMRLEREAALLATEMSDLEHLAAVTKELSGLTAHISRFQTDLSERKAELNQLEEVLQRARDRRRVLAELESAWLTAKANLDLCRQLADLQAKATAAAAAAETAVAEAEEAKARQSVATAERDRLAAILLAADRQVQEARTRATEVATAVARIATHLGPHDDHCPVCATPFKPEDLKLLAVQAAQAQSAELEAAESEYARASTEHSRAAQELTMIAAVTERAEAAAAEAETAQAAAVALRNRVADALGELGDQEPLVVASTREAAAGAAVAAEQLTIDSAEFSVRAALERREPLMAEIGDLELRLEDASLHRESAERQQRAIYDRQTARGRADARLEDLGEELAENNRQLAQGRARLAEVEAAVQAAVRGEVDAGAAVERARAQLEASLAAAQAASQDAAALLAQWTATGMQGNPSEASIEAIRGELTVRREALDALNEDQAGLAASHEAAVQHQELSDLIRAMQLEAGADAAHQPEVHEATLSAELDEARAAQALTESARKAVNAYADRLQSAARDFSVRFLAPLNDLIGNFNDALLSWPGESVRFNAAHHVDTTRFDMKLRFRDELDEALYNTRLPPQVVLSEGQLAANGFSILCAASTAYPWSRWRALLLDDPLQHNDIIHAAAFVDLMRNLVELEGYQLLMSSHDRAESEFIARKFDAANLPCTVVTLTAPSKDGVRFEQPRPNRAALAHLRGELALSG